MTQRCSSFVLIFRSTRNYRCLSLFNSECNNFYKCAWNIKYSNETVVLHLITKYYMQKFCEMPLATLPAAVTAKLIIK